MFSASDIYRLKFHLILHSIQLESMEQFRS